MSTSFLEGFLDRATLIEVPVTVYQKAGLFARLQELNTKIDAHSALNKHARYEDVPGEELMSEGTPADRSLEELQAQAEQIIQELRECETTWFFGAISPEEEAAIARAFPMPKNPFKPLKDPFPVLPPEATDAQAVAYLEGVTALTQRAEEHKTAFLSSPAGEAYSRALQVCAHKRALERIVRGFRRIEQGGAVVATAITHDEVARLPKALGDVTFRNMSKAVESASTQWAELSADFLASNSPTTQSS